MDLNDLMSDRLGLRTRPKLDADLHPDALREIGGRLTGLAALREAARILRAEQGEHGEPDERLARLDACVAVAEDAHKQIVDDRARLAALEEEMLSSGSTSQFGLAVSELAAAEPDEDALVAQADTLREMRSRMLEHAASFAQAVSAGTSLAGELGA